jgi:hypothetical protein
MQWTGKRLPSFSRIPEGEHLLINVLNEENPLSIERLSERFGVQGKLYAVKDTTLMAPLLYY